MAQVLYVIARPQSDAAKAYRVAIGRSALPEAIAPGIQPHPEFDLADHGGKTIPTLSYATFYLGAHGKWAASDIQSIDAALAGAMTDSALNEIMGQYFGGTAPTTTVKASQTVNIAPHHRTDKTAVETIVGKLLAGGHLAGLDLSQTVVNLMLPPGVVLSDSGGAQKLQGLDEAAADSLHGLGGYHGSTHVGGQVIYYAVGVYSQQLPNGRENGIVAFDQPWKNVVATFYHELNEARTDADVEDAIRAGNDPSADKLLGWISPQGYEVGDEPVFEAGGDLSLVFQEVPVGSGTATAPIQLMWSNRVHGPEGPVPASSTTR
jgi:hypothetical protein